MNFLFSWENAQKRVDLSITCPTVSDVPGHVWSARHRKPDRLLIIAEQNVRASNLLLYFLRYIRDSDTVAFENGFMYISSEKFSTLTKVQNTTDTSLVLNFSINVSQRHKFHSRPFTFRCSARSAWQFSFRRCLSCTDLLNTYRKIAACYCWRIFCWSDKNIIYLFLSINCHDEWKNLFVKRSYCWRFFNKTN